MLTAVGAQTRVRRLMKQEPDIRAITKEASMLVTKAAEMFLEALAEQALACKSGGEPSLTYEDLGAFGLAAQHC